MHIHKTKINTEKVKEQYTSKIAQTQEKLKTEIERRLRSQKSAMEVFLKIYRLFNSDTRSFKDQR